MASSWFPKAEAGGLSQKQSAETCPQRDSCRFHLCLRWRGSPIKSRTASRPGHRRSRTGWEPSL